MQLVNSCSLPLDFIRLTLKTFSWGTFEFKKGVKFMKLNNLVMLNWDPSPTGQQDGVHYTISSTDDVEEIMVDRMKEHTDEFWVTYLTPSGGVHAFLLSHSMLPIEAAPMMEDMQCDKLYIKMNLKGNYFGVRISPKLGRKGDYVASYWKTFGNPELALPEHLETLRIKESYIKGAKYLT